MATQEHTTRPLVDTHNSVVIRMKRKRQAPPMESFFIDKTNDGIFAKPKPTKIGSQHKTVFVRTTSIDVTTPTETGISKVLGQNDIGGQMKRLKLGDTDNSKEESANLQVYDIVQDIETDQYTLLPSAQPQNIPSPKLVVTCNGEEMIREILPNTQPYLQPDDCNYVYDLYLTEGADLSMFDDPTSILINPLEYDITWVDPVTKAPHNHYFDDYNVTGLSDDSNDETNWRNEYPEEPDSDLDQEIDREYSSRFVPEQEDYYTGDFDYFNSNQAALYNDPWAGELSGMYLKQEGDLYYNVVDEISDEGF